MLYYDNENFDIIYLLHVLQASNWFNLFFLLSSHFFVALSLESWYFPSRSIFGGLTLWASSQKPFSRSVLFLKNLCCLSFFERPELFRSLNFDFSLSFFALMLLSNSTTFYTILLHAWSSVLYTTLVTQLLCDSTSLNFLATQTVMSSALHARLSATYVMPCVNGWLRKSRPTFSNVCPWLLCTVMAYANVTGNCFRWK